MHYTKALGAIALTAGIVLSGSLTTARAASARTVVHVSNPMGLAIDTRGNPRTPKWGYTVNYYTNTVVRFGTGGSRLGSWQYSPPGIYKLGVGIAVGGSGNVFLADPATNSVVKFDPYGHRLATFTGFGFPSAVALDRSGNIYVAERNAGRITKLSSSGAVQARWLTPWAGGAGRGAPFSIAVDRTGRIFVAVMCVDGSCTRDDHMDAPQAVLRLNSAGVMQSNLVGGTPHGGRSKEEEPWVGLSGIALDSAGTLYVAGILRDSRGNLTNGVLTYGQGSYLTGRYLAPSMPGILGVAVDAKKSIYVAQGDRILQIAR